MTNPITQLREALLARSWSLAEQAYESLTGETPPKPEEDSKPTYEVLPSASPIYSRSSEQVVHEIRSEKQSQSAGPVLPMSHNEFADYNVDHKEVEIDRLLHKNKTPPPPRDPPKKVKVKCRECTTQSEVFPYELPAKLGTENPLEKWVCNECVNNKPRKR